MNRFIAKLLIVVLCSCSFSGILWSQPAYTERSGADCIAYIPSAISPNGDGINERFEIQHQCELKNFSLRIFDQANRLVFSSQQPDQAWDGSLGGRPAPEGYYRYAISFETPDSGEPVTQEGELALVR
jgi:gliding motility-associated-like protein